VSRLWSRLHQEERAMSLVEMLVVMIVLTIILAGLANVLVSGSRAQYDLSTQLNAQQNARIALSRIEYEGRCASTATLLGSGAGVSFSLPAHCTKAVGTVTWCVTSGALKRYTAATCTGTSQVYVRDISSATPFSLVTATGNLPRLAITLVSTPLGRRVDRFTVTDSIALRNSAPTP
jgi:prepilin-type N-terminal cleavage/methylation domain-containing protein